MYFICYFGLFSCSAIGFTIRLPRCTFNIQLQYQNYLMSDSCSFCDSTQRLITSSASFNLKCNTVLRHPHCNCNSNSNSNYCTCSGDLVNWLVRTTVFKVIYQTQKNCIWPQFQKLRVENTTRSGVFLMNFEVHGSVVKHCLECLICLLSWN